MTPALRHPAARAVSVLALTLLLNIAAFGGQAHAQVTAFKQAVAESASIDDDIATFYRNAGYAPLWTGEGPEFTARRASTARCCTSSSTRRASTTSSSTAAPPRAPHSR